jgi:hypothetical protein
MRPYLEKNPLKKKKKGLAEWLKVQALSLNSSTKKNNNNNN